MKFFTSVLLALSFATPAATAQTRSQPSLVLTIYAGTASGAGLWNIARQPLCLPNPSCASSDPHDTLRLTRDLGSSLLAGAGATYYANRHLGVTLEVFYLGMPLDDGCTGLFYNPDTEARNEQLCNNITSASLSTSAIAFFGGVVVRAAPTRAISPFVRAGAGLLSYSAGIIEVAGVYYLSNGQPETRVVILDDKPKTSALTVHAAAGFTARLSPGYQFRFELRDILVPLKYITGPADGLGQVSTATRVHHRVALTLGLDVILERKPGRRY